MASSARIEELEKKFNENPRRYFAPLANEYRKAGDLTQAISICRTYVPQQPGHMSGHIVFGQALFEAGELDEARGVFESALQLDPENLIALRHLGDISRAGGEIASARAWYRRVLDADPRNEEIAAQLLSLDGVADAPPPAPVTGVEARSVLDDLAAGGWQEINPERTLELPAALAESAQRITEGTASWLETEADVPAPAKPEEPIDAFAESVGADIDGFYGDAYTASMAEAPPADAPPPADQGLGLEVMEFVPPARRQRESDPTVAVTAESGAGDTPAAFVTETMAELYLQQGFRDEALEVYRQLLVQSPEDDTLRERVAQLESGSRSSFSAAGGVSDSVIEAATQRRNAPTVRSVRAFFGDLAARRVVTRHADRAVPVAEPDFYEEPPAAATEVAESPPVAEPQVAAPADTVHEETEAPPAIQSVETTAIVVAAPPADSAPVEPLVAEPKPVEAAQPTANEPPPRAPRPPELPTGGFGIRPGLYDQGSYAEDASGSPDLGNGFGANPSPLAEPEYGGETLISRRRDDVDEFGLPTSGDAESFAFDPPEPAAAPPTTGSVNGLFPNAHVTPSDEAAAETLSTAFGGDSAAEAQKPGVRRASTELSLDSVFRESPPAAPASPTSGTRREPGAFSFDQFFGYDPFANGESATKDTARTDTTQDAPTEHPAPAEPAAETEQFSSWLSGLKKK